MKTIRLQEVAKKKTWSVSFQRRRENTATTCQSHVEVLDTLPEFRASEPRRSQTCRFHAIATPAIFNGRKMTSLRNTLNFKPCHTVSISNLRNGVLSTSETQN
ncbi:unnamed protein product [Cladocopium goreaui]|uniref:Uncharacterized protein n=1 Tax=Cladocopium goreaui TaxID=2562237 RepID=A0A9P1GB02_9DINO|nr:unnamed protein product [Cladocopium goreaui]